MTPTPDPPSPVSPQRIHGTGELADLIRSKDWSATPLGPIHTWPAALLTSLNHLLLTPFPFCIYWGQDLTLLYNDAYRSLLNRKHPSALGSPGPVVWQEAWDAIGPPVRAALLLGHSESRSEALIPVLIDGILQDRWFTYGLYPIYDGGRIVGVANSVTEGTTAVLANRKLRESETLANRILQSIGDAVIVTDRHTHITRMNPVAEALTGWTLDQARGKPLPEIFRILNETSRQPPEDPASKVSRLGTIVGLTNHTILLAQDGTETHIDDSAAPIRNEDGTLTGIVLVFRDINERRSAEVERERLRLESLGTIAELRAIYDTAAVALALIDATTFRYIRVNHRLVDMLDQPMVEIIGSSVFASIGDTPELRSTLTKVAAGTPVNGFVFEGELPNSPGLVRTWRIDLHPVLAPTGEVTAIASATIEITQQKKAEAALLQNEKLAAVGRLAASIAHEINNPLESVTNLLYLARTSTAPAEIQEYLDIAERELRRVSAISNQTLRFHRQSSRPVPVTCQDLIESVLSIYQGRLINSRITVEKRKRANQPVTCFDGEIRQVLNNLVGNAIDAMHPTGGRLLLRSREATRWSNGQRGLLLTIADSGPGIAPAVRRRLFEPFFTTKGIGGTGLGLWISKEIVTRHHGTLHVRSSQAPSSSGSVFALFLPFNNTDL